MQVILSAELRPNYEKILSGIKKFEEKWMTVRKEAKEGLETLDEELSNLSSSEIEGIVAALSLKEKHPHLYYTDPIEIYEKRDNNDIINHILIKVPPQKENTVGMCTIQIYHTGTINITYYDPIGEDICYYFLDLLCSEYSYKNHNPHRISLVELEACKSRLKKALLSRLSRGDILLKKRSSIPKPQIPADLELLKKKLEEAYRKHQSSQET